MTLQDTTGIKGRHIIIWATLLALFLGGIIVTYFSWRWIFYINVPPDIRYPVGNRDSGCRRSGICFYYCNGSIGY